MPALGVYNSITVAANTPVQLTAPGSGGYSVVLLNTAGGNLYISDLSNPGANATSFKLPAGLYSPTLSARGALWISSDAAGTISAYCAAAR